VAKRGGKYSKKKGMKRGKEDTGIAKSGLLAPEDFRRFSISSEEREL